MTTLAQLANDHATVRYGEGEGASLTLEYRPRLATSLANLRLMRDLEGFNIDAAGMAELVDVVERLVASLCNMLLSWDALEPDGSVVPITVERLEREDLITLMTLFGAIMKDARHSLGEPNGTRSRTPMSGTSARRGSSTISPRGTSRQR